MIETVEEALVALSNVGAFEDAVDTGGVFSGSNLTVDDAQDRFETVQGIDVIAFGSAGNSRFGAYMNRERTSALGSLFVASGENGIGAFAYSTLDATRRSALPRRGEAYYQGDTVAVSREHPTATYTGSISLRAVFSNRQVSGTVTNLQDERGDPWTYLGDDALRIFLPTATMATSDGSFSSTAGSDATIENALRFSSTPSRRLDGQLRGQFVGTSANPGTSVIGTWSLQRSGLVTLTGGFGADWDSSAAPEVPPIQPTPVDRGGQSETWLITQPDSRGDIVIDALDSSGDRLEFSASTLYADRFAAAEGDTLVNNALAAVQGQRRAIEVYIQTNLGQGPRDGAWVATNNALESVFGVANVLGASYPPGSTQARRDREALEDLALAESALSSESALLSALGSGGIFEDILTGSYDIGEIYSARSNETVVHFDYTDLTRFGAWMKLQRTDATSTTFSLATGSESPDVFAYSPIEQTQYSRNDFDFFADTTADYAGRTLAVETSGADPEFYDGNIDLSVSWSSTASRSRVTAEISNLNSLRTGDPFAHGGGAIRSLIFSESSVRVGVSNRIGFDDSSPTVRVRYPVFSGIPERTFTGRPRAFEGKFVGSTVSGPSAVIGVWEFDTLKGSFGAEFIP